MRKLVLVLLFLAFSTLCFAQRGGGARSGFGGARGYGGGRSFMGGGRVGGFNGYRGGGRFAGGNFGFRRGFGSGFRGYSGYPYWSSFGFGYSYPYSYDPYVYYPYPYIVPGPTVGGYFYGGHRYLNDGRWHRFGR